ncbi:hypothetical protein LCGC14_2175330, partial [marine sediment metagenome]
MTHPLYTACLIAILPLGVGAETFDIKMLNKGEAGRMIFEPDHVSARVGDTLRFIATDRGHNAETIDGMLPTDATPFAGRINEEIEVDYTRAKPIVKVTGEFWAQTTEGDGNFNMFPFLQGEGAEVLVEPVATWIAYMLNQAKMKKADSRGLEDGENVPDTWDLKKKLELEKQFRKSQMT